MLSHYPLQERYSGRSLESSSPSTEPGQLQLAMGGLMATAQLGPIATDYQVAKTSVSLLGITMAAW